MSSTYFEHPSVHPQEVLWYFLHASIYAARSMAGHARWANFGKQNWHQAHPAIYQTAYMDG